jgi:hypothetical protein
VSVVELQGEESQGRQGLDRNPLSSLTQPQPNISPSPNIELEGHCEGNEALPRKERRATSYLGLCLQQILVIRIRLSLKRPEQPCIGTVLFSHHAGGSIPLTQTSTRPPITAQISPPAANGAAGSRTGGGEALRQG